MTAIMIAPKRWQTWQLGGGGGGGGGWCQKTVARGTED